MHKFLRYIFTFRILFNTSVLFAQEKPEMPDVMRTNGQIYVVVAVVVTIVIGLVLYLWNLDRKISKIEKSQK